jgi:hypothetical protein
MNKKNIFYFDIMYFIKYYKLTKKSKKNKKKKFYFFKKSKNNLMINLNIKKEKKMDFF